MANPTPKHLFRMVEQKCGAHRLKKYRDYNVKVLRLVGFCWSLRFLGSPSLRPN